MALTFGGLAAAQPASAPDPFVKRTEIVTNAVAGIQARIVEIEVLRGDSSARGQPNRTACIDEKLKRAKATLQSANTIMSGWSLGRDDAEYAQRSTDRMLLVQLYASIALEEARACAEPKLETGNEFTGAVPPEQNEFVPARRPRFDRPPLASPY